MRQMIIFAVILFFSQVVSGQTKFSEFKAGLINPKDAKAGFYGGVNLGRSVDENVGVSLAIDVYRKSYDKETEIVKEVETGGVTKTTKVKDFEQSTTMLPLFFQIHYQGPITQIFNLRASAGIGYELLWNSWTDYENDEDGLSFFHGFGWHADLGATYPLSRASDIFAEVFYHGGKPSKDEGKKEGQPIYQEVDMSGIGFRVGMRIYNFGF